MGLKRHSTRPGPLIEDGVPGVIAAVKAGMTAIGFTGGGHCQAGHPDRLYAAGAACVVGAMSELRSLLAIDKAV